MVHALLTNAPGGGIDYRDVIIEEEEHDLVLSPLYTGICGTDRGIVNGSLNFAKNPEKSDYLVLGHESVCVVRDSSNSQFKEGDLVVPLVRRPGNCPNCLIGRQDNCSDGNKKEAGVTGKHGFMRSRFNEDSQFVVRIDDPYMEKISVLTEPLKNVVKGFEVIETISKRSVYAGADSSFTNKNCVVIGTGTEAFLYGIMSSEYGFNTALTNRHPLSREKMDLISDFSLNFFDYSTDIAYPFKSEIDLVIDTSGDPATVLKFLRLMNYNGIFLFFGTNGKAPASSINGNDIDHIVERNITIAGSVDAAKVHYIRAVKYLKRWFKSLPVESIITGEYRPEYTEIFKKKPEDEIKSVIKWGE
ncbi:MAG: alcohol dehydrogenase catalytic domain-containing protein [Candidatus Thermoplasmatota archaeon]|nr:alcohol dehydrogenase catalytic domain-containing protein [Candidatus Thermoplasmatota archaeon]